MDDMEEYEIQTLSGMLDYAGYYEWRRMRLLYHGIISPYLKNKDTTPEKLIPLPGDDDSIEEARRDITNAEIDLLRKRADANAEKMKRMKHG